MNILNHINFNFYTKQSISQHNVEDCGQWTSNIVKCHSNIFQTEVVQSYHGHKYER